MSTAILEKEMTFGEYLEESSLFGYSKEYFEMMKTAQEITLMELYIESQEFLLENSNLSDEHKTKLMVESANATEDSLQQMMESTAAKERGLISKIIKLFQRAKTAIIAFFKRILNVFTNAEGTKIKNLEDALEKANNNAKGWQALSAAEKEKHAGATSKVKSLVSELKAADAKAKELLENNENMARRLVVVGGQRDNLEAMYKAMVNKYSGIDADVARVIQDTTKWIAKECVVQVPDFIGNLDVTVDLVNKALVNWNHKKRTGKKGASKLAAADASLDQLINRMSIKDGDRITMVKMTISAADIKDTIEKLEAASNRFDEEVKTILASIEDAATAGGEGAPHPDVKAAREGVSAKFGEVHQMLTKLAALYNERAGDAIHVIKTFAEQKNRMMALHERVISAFAAMGPGSASA